MGRGKTITIETRKKKMNFALNKFNMKERIASKKQELRKLVLKKKITEEYKKMIILTSVAVMNTCAKIEQHVNEDFTALPQNYQDELKGTYESMMRGLAPGEHILDTRNVDRWDRPHMHEFLSIVAYDGSRMDNIFLPKVEEEIQKTKGELEVLKEKDKAYSLFKESFVSTYLKEKTLADDYDFEYDLKGKTQFWKLIKSFTKSHLGQ